MSKVARGIRRGLEQAVQYAKGKASKNAYRLHVPVRADDQRWFHHPEMQRRISKAEADVAEGQTHVTHSVEEAQALLDHFKSKRPRRRRSPKWACRTDRDGGTIL